MQILDICAKNLKTSQAVYDVGGKDEAGFFSTSQLTQP